MLVFFDDNFTSYNLRFMWDFVIISIYCFTFSIANMIVENLQAYQVYKYEMLHSISKKHLKFGKMIKSALFEVCSIACYTFFPSYGQFMNTTPVKSSPLAANRSSSHFFTSSYEPKCICCLKSAFHAYSLGITSMCLETRLFSAAMRRNQRRTFHIDLRNTIGKSFFNFSIIKQLDRPLI